MRCWIELDANALVANYNILKKLALPAQAMPVVKSNAYGHGLDEIFGILKNNDLHWLAVNYCEEGIRLRELGFSGRILIVGPPDPQLLELYASHNLEIILGDFDFLHEWKHAEHRPLGHLKIDTGMSRQGFLPENIQKAVDLLKPFQKQLYGILSHFANVEDVLEHEYAKKQLEAFNECLSVCKRNGLDLVPHIASSASALLMPESQFCFARTGIALYGFWPSSKTRLSFLQKNREIMHLKPVLSWFTRVASLKTVRAKQYVGYGCSFRAQKDMLVAVLPVGYFEGYPRLAGEKNSYVLIGGQRCSIIGRICMNMMMVDVSHLKRAFVGDLVTLIGHDQDESISAEDLASWAETIHYEIVTQLNSAIPRKVMGSANHQ